MTTNLSVLYAKYKTHYNLAPTGTTKDNKDRGWKKVNSKKKKSKMGRGEKLLSHCPLKIKKLNSDLGTNHGSVSDITEKAFIFVH